jgi:hypothetical protein
MFIVTQALHGNTAVKSPVLPSTSWTAPAAKVIEVEVKELAPAIDNVPVAVAADAIPLRLIQAAVAAANRNFLFMLDSHYHYRRR